VEHRLGLTTVTGLLTVVTTLTLGEEGSLGSMLVLRVRGCLVVVEASHLASLVLGDLVLGVLLAVLALAVGPARLRDVDLWAQEYQRACSCGFDLIRVCARVCLH